VNLCAGELRKHGMRVRLQEQPFQVLTMLLEHPGQVVSRDPSRLWLHDDQRFGRKEPNMMLIRARLD
jgi:DNA-binding response OmpR family regulator